MAGHFHILVTLAALALTLTPARGCSPVPGVDNMQYEDMGMKMYHSDITLLGVGQRAIADQRYENVYSMEFEVKCIFKKPEDVQVNAMITINNIGEVPGLCHATNITTGQMVIVYVSQNTDKIYSPTFSSDPGSSQHREELLGVCGFKPEYPTGMPVEAQDSEACTVDYDYEGQCHDPTTNDEEPEEPPVGPVVPPTPPPPPVDEGKVEVEVEEPAAPTKAMDTKASVNDNINSTEPEVINVDGEDTKTNDNDNDNTNTNNAGTDEGKDVPYEPAKSNDDGNPENSAAPFMVSVVLLVMSILSVAIL